MEKSEIEDLTIEEVSTKIVDEKSEVKNFSIEVMSTKPIIEKKLMEKDLPIINVPIEVTIVDVGKYIKRRNSLLVR